jgi:hypothetical protein
LPWQQGSFECSPTAGDKIREKWVKRRCAPFLFLLLIIIIKNKSDNCKILNI